MAKEKDKKKVNIDIQDLKLTILGCFRYSLGRRTYMPDFTVDMIKAHSKIFKEYEWKRFIEEINDCKSLGDECDIHTWMELKQFAEERMRILKENGN